MPVEGNNSGHYPCPPSHMATIPPSEMALERFISLEVAIQDSYIRISDYECKKACFFCIYGNIKNGLGITITRQTFPKIIGWCDWRIQEAIIVEIYKMLRQAGNLVQVKLDGMGIKCWQKLRWNIVRMFNQNEFGVFLINPIGECAICH